jgi:hypothetical protein
MGVWVLTRRRSIFLNMHVLFIQRSYILVMSSYILNPCPD